MNGTRKFFLLGVLLIFSNNCTSNIMLKKGAHLPTIGIVGVDNVRPILVVKSSLQKKYRVLLKGMDLESMILQKLENGIKKKNKFSVSWEKIAKFPAFKKEMKPAELLNYLAIMKRELGKAKSQYVLSLQILDCAVREAFYQEKAELQISFLLIDKKKNKALWRYIVNDSRKLDKTQQDIKLKKIFSEMASKMTEGAISHLHRNM